MDPPPEARMKTVAFPFDGDKQAEMCALAFKEPFIISGSEKTKDLCEKNDQMGKELKDFHDLFDPSNQKKTHGRGQVRLVDASLVGMVSAELLAYFPESVRAVITNYSAHEEPELHKALAPAVFALAKGRDSIGFGLGGVGGVRATFQGTRTIVAAPGLFNKVQKFNSKDSKQNSNC